MFDLETLDTKPSAIVLSLGAVRFDPRDFDIRDEKLLLKIEVDRQFDLGRTMSDDTIDWWSQQSPEIIEEAFSPDRVSFHDAIDQFHKFVWNSDLVWSQGSFDVNIMEDIYRTLKRTPPWQYWQIRDSRTLFDFIEANLDRTKGHDAFEDAKEQALGVQRALKKIKWNGTKI
jgi:3' exoribonuclease, RNase T-like